MASQKNITATNANKSPEFDRFAKVDGPADVLTTFSTDVILTSGLNVVRSLGGGKYEIVNLDTISQNVVGSNDFAALLTAVPERQAALTVSKVRWDAAILKCDVAVRLTSKQLDSQPGTLELIVISYPGKDVFRLFGLPLELQEAIYQLVFYNPKGLCLRPLRLAVNRYQINPFSGLNFLVTCREVYEAGMKIFRTNCFRLDHRSTIHLRYKTNFARNLVEIEIDWEGKWNDNAVLHDIEAYPNLRVLNIRFWVGAVNYPGRQYYGNKLFQEDEAFEWFNKLRGFDKLVSLRGLKRVTFTIYGQDTANIDQQIRSKIPAVELAMNEFLNRELTQPKPPLLVSFVFSCIIIMSLVRDTNGFAGHPFQRYRQHC
jgi:hypothetical protein